MGLIVGGKPPWGSPIVGVAMEATARRITADEYFAMSVEDPRTELVDGVRFESALGDLVRGRR
jgi:hypothetical protein